MLVVWDFFSPPIFLEGVWWSRVGGAGSGAVCEGDVAAAVEESEVGFLCDILCDVMFAAVEAVAESAAEVVDGGGVVVAGWCAAEVIEDSSELAVEESEERGGGC